MASVSPSCSQQAAHEMGIEFICRDLSLMSRPTWSGAEMNGKTTIYLPPDFLPPAEKGSWRSRS